jgi:hypothetical protein
MNISTRRLICSLVAAIIVVIGQDGFARAASPTPAAPPSGPTGHEMLSVQPSLISVSVKPGSSTTVQLTLRAAADLNVGVKSQGLSQGTDGSFRAVPADQDTSPYSLRSLISVSPATLQLKAGDTTKLEVTVSVPDNVGDGTRYAIVTITGMPTSPAGSSNVGFGVELGVSAIVQIADTPQTKTGEIKGIDVTQSLPGAPIPVKVSFLNTGNSHYGAVPNELMTTALLLDPSSEDLADATASGNQLSVIPSFTRDIALTMSPTKALVDGTKYHLEVGVGLKDGTVLDRKALDFTWSGGEVLGASSTPVLAPPATPSRPSDTALFILAALLGAAVVAVLFLLVPRVRRRSAHGSGDGPRNQ